MAMTDAAHPPAPGASPAAAPQLADDGRALSIRWQDGTELASYVYQPHEPQLESPRPYFHPVRTLAGDLVSLYRPHDHVWHKGIAWSLPNVGPENFWGGVTYRRGDGYLQLPNNGRMRHERFLAVPDNGPPGVLRVAEELSWLTERGGTWLTETRRLAVRVWPGYRAWVLAFGTTLRNVSGAGIVIGSPTTEGRENAGYGGLFWRGPRSFTGGAVLAPGGAGGDEYMGWRGPWLGFTGRHDGHGRASTLLFTDCPGNLGYPGQWFVRSTPFACLCPAPFFAAEHTLAAGATLALRYGVAVADGALTAGACQDLAARMDPAALLGEPGEGR